MTWQEVRRYHPNSWLLLEALEALEAHSQDGFRILDKLAVISVFPDGNTAWQAYQELHRKDRARELYVLYSSKQDVAIQELFRFSRFAPEVQFGTTQKMTSSSGVKNP